MIQGLKDAIGSSWLLKGFLGLAMISFAVFGIGDAVNPAADPNVAIKVDQFEVRSEELQRRFNSQYEDLRDALGPDFTARDAVELGIMDSLIAELSQMAALQAASVDLNVDVADDTLRRVAMDQPAFKDQFGNFSRMQLNAVLAANNLTEQAFIDLLRADVTRQTLLQPVAANADAPAPMVDALFQYRAEQRVANLLYVADELISIEDEADEDAIRAVYDENISSFTAPEFRTAEMIVIRPRDLVPPESISQEELQSFYDENIDRYRTPPTRTVRQLIFPTEADAQAALDSREDGDTLVEVGERSGAGAPIDLGTLNETDSIGFDLSPIFAVTDTSIAGPVETDFGWHLFEVMDLTVGTIKALPVVRDEIVDFIIQDRAFDEMYEATVYLEDQLAGGVPMAEIGETPGYTYVRYDSLNRDGRDINGSPQTFPVDRERFLIQVFAADPGIESPLVETMEYAYVLRVTDVIPPAPKPFEVVRAEVEALWESEARAAASQSKAEEMMAEIGPSTNLPDLAATDDAVEYAILGPVTRFGDSLRLDYIIPARLVSPAFMDTLFAAEVGDLVSARVANGHIAARLVEVIEPSDPDLENLRAQISTSVSSTLANDLVAAFSDAVTAPYDVFVNREAVDALTPQ